MPIATTSSFAATDLVFFFGSLLGVMAIGLFASRREKTSEEFFLAGRSVRWWGVAGSIFGSNVSANHLVGMLGIGYSIGFAQSHFELGAIAALMLLAYGFLPVYRKLGVFTLSDYLGRRYDDRSQTLYAVILILVAVVQLTGGFYIGARSLGTLLEGSGFELTYAQGIVALALITATYTIVGGLKAVIYTDVMQSVLLLAAGVAVALLTFAQPEVGGWSGMMAADAAKPVAEQKMHLYLPSNHPDLPWSGALSGLLILHLFYWGTNQTIVQRALAARSDQEARVGIVVAGFGKLLIPFFAIGGGVAAAQLFSARFTNTVIEPDAAMPELIKLVVPMGYGLFGLIMAGLIGAILSSIDSLVNSASTLVTFDLYKKYINPDATDRHLLPLGRWVIAILIGGSAVLALATYDPTGGGNFFLRVSSQAGHFTPGLVVAFALGMFWRRATASGSFWSIVLGPAFSFAIVEIYALAASSSQAVENVFGTDLNFLHRVMLTVVFCIIVHVLMSRRSAPGRDDARYTFAELSGVAPQVLIGTLRNVAILLVALLLLGLGVDRGLTSPLVAAVVGAIAAACPFAPVLKRISLANWFRDDRFWSAALCSSTVFLLFRFF